MTVRPLRGWRGVIRAGVRYVLGCGATFLDLKSFRSVSAIHQEMGPNVGQNDLSMTLKKSMLCRVVPGAGIEPAWPCDRGILSPLKKLSFQVTNPHKDLDIQGYRPYSAFTLIHSKTHRFTQIWGTDGGQTGDRISDQETGNGKMDSDQL